MLTKRILVILAATACTLYQGLATADVTQQSSVKAADMKMPENFHLSSEAHQRITQTLKDRHSRVMMKQTTRQVSKAQASLIGLSKMKDGGGAFEGTPIFIDNEGRIRLELTVDEVGLADIPDFERLGVEITLIRDDLETVVIAVPPDRLDDLITVLDSWPSVNKIRPLFVGSLNAGSVNSQGDQIQGSLDARKQFGVDGGGVSVCVISDGLQGAETAAATGDLPVDIKGSPFIERCSLNQDRGAEGTAMLEIIHDVAPGAKLGFCPAFGNGQAGVVDAIEWLAFEAFGGEGCDIIVDDIAIMDEPYFQDGPIAQAVDQVTWAGVSYFSSAGNSADHHYELAYIDAAPADDSHHLHDFGQAAGQPSELAWGGILAPGTFTAAVLQWSEAIGAAISNYDLLLFDVNGQLAGTPGSVFTSSAALQGNEIQDGNDNPIEFAYVVNTTEINQRFFLVVDRVSGNDHTLEINFNGQQFILDPRFNVSEGSIWGHAAARFGIAVAATGATENIDETPNPNLDIIEYFSSHGPARIFYTSDGRPWPHKRNKPDITAPDGVSVTGAAGFGPTFYGTSASAPHAAAVAALLIDAAGWKLPPWAIKRLLQFTADDRGEAGPDATWGFGFINAFTGVNVFSLF